MLLVTHNLALAEQISDFVVVLAFDEGSRVEPHEWDSEDELLTSLSNKGDSTGEKPGSPQEGKLIDSGGGAASIMSVGE